MASLCLRLKAPTTVASPCPCFERLWPLSLSSPFTYILSLSLARSSRSIRVEENAPKPESENQCPKTHRWFCDPPRVVYLETTEKAIIRKEKHLEEETTEDEDVIYKIEVAANRYDLLFLEGLAQALLVFIGIDPMPTYTLGNIRRESMLKMHVNLRRRTLVAIGTHDLDTIDGPFTYEALPPSP